MSYNDLKIPFTDPVLVFAMVLLAILITPLLFSRFKIPGIVGLIISGVILGPHGFHILERDTSIVLFGTVGLLYIMFMAGLEMDINDFKRNKNKSLVFGTLTFLFPFIIGFIASHYVLNYNMMASILLASMFSTHTLIAYPIISKLGIIQNRTVIIVIGGTIITDAAVLIILAVITNVQESNLSLFLFIKLIASLSILVFVILWGVPRLGRWFFRKLESEGHAQYLFVLTVVFLAGFLSHLAGVEPIIGAFLAGLALNQLIPNTSTLMHRIDFIGNALFIPFFLISVGMLVDFRILMKGPEALFIAAVIIIVSFTGKWLAAYFTQQIYKFNRTERVLMWGMSSGHAAATIAVIIIGYNLSILDENVLNGTILLILVSCLGSSLISERAGRKIALEEVTRTQAMPANEQRILVPVANLENINRLIDLSLFIKEPKSEQPAFPLFVLSDKENADKQIVHYQSKMELALKNSGIETKRETVFRVDLNIANGILRAVTELRITTLITGWNGHVASGNSFGPILDGVVNGTNIQIMICRLVKPLNTTKRIVVAIPENMEHETGFIDMISTLSLLAKHAGASMVIFSTKRTYEKINQISPKADATERLFQPIEQWVDLFGVYKSVERNDLFITLLARPYTVSYNNNMKKIPKLLISHFKETSVIMLYPEQR